MVQWVGHDLIPKLLWVWSVSLLLKIKFWFEVFFHTANNSFHVNLLDTDSSFIGTGCNYKWLLWSKKETNRVLSYSNGAAVSFVVERYLGHWIKQQAAKTIPALSLQLEIISLKEEPSIEKKKPLAKFIWLRSTPYQWEWRKNLKHPSNTTQDFWLPFSNGYKTYWYITAVLK